MKLVIYYVSPHYVTEQKQKSRGVARSPVTKDVSPPVIINESLEHQLAQKYEGKLLLRNEIHLNDELFSHLLTNKYFTASHSLIRTVFSKRCTRCNNSKSHLFAYFPCAKCQTVHLYCRNCIMMGRVSTCENLYKWSGKRYKWPHHNDACTWQGELTPAQNRAANQVVKAIDNQNELLVWAVTGAGKTEILFKGITLALSQGKRICITTPRADVVRELLPRIQRAFSAVKVQGLYGKSRDREGTAQLIIATTHQLIRFHRAFDVIIIDEIDAFPYHQDPSLQFATNRAAKPDSTKIYLTATPRQDLLYKLKTNQLSHCFVPIRYHGHPLPIPQSISDYSLSKRLTSNALPKSLVNWLGKRKNTKRQLLIFVPTIKLANRLRRPVAEILLKRNVITDKKYVASVHAEDHQREQKINQFRNKKRYALITTTILERGVTFPSIDVVVIQANHIVFDEAALVQIAGRAGRNAQDPTGEVLFIHDGKTDAISRSISSINQMNIRGTKMMQSIKEGD